MAVLEMNNVSKRYRRPGGRRQQLGFALRDLTLHVDPGEVVAIVGRNGAGKSTLVKVAAGVTAPTQGEVVRPRRVAPLIEVGAGFHPELTGRENVAVNAKLLGLTRNEVNRRFDQIVEFSGLGDAIERPVREYSSGMFMRLGFAVAIHTEPQVLLVDEVLAVGDLPFQRRCIERISLMRSQGVGILLVTHDLGTVQEIADRALLLELGETKSTGDAASVVADYLSLLRQSPAESQAEWSASSDELQLVDVHISPDLHALIPPGTRVRAEITVRAKENPTPAGVFGFRLLPEKGAPVGGWLDHDQGAFPALAPHEVATVALEFTMNTTGGVYTLDFAIAREDWSSMMFKNDKLAEIPIAKTVGEVGVVALVVSHEVRRSG